MKEAFDYEDRLQTLCRHQFGYLKPRGDGGIDIKYRKKITEKQNELENVISEYQRRIICLAGYLLC